MTGSTAPGPVLTITCGILASDWLSLWRWCASTWSNEHLRASRHSASYVERYPELARFRAALAVFDEPVVLPSGAAAAAFVTSAPGAAEPVAGRSALLSACLQRWYDLKAQAQPPMPEDLCREHPELLEEVKQRIEGVAAIEALFGAVNDHLDRTQPGQLPDDRWNTLAAAPGVAPLPARPSPGGDADRRRPGAGLPRSWASSATAAWVSSTRPGIFKLNRVVALKMVLAGGHAGSEELRPLPDRGRGGGGLAAPQYRAGLRGWPAGRVAVHGPGVRQRRQPGRHDCVTACRVPRDAAWLVEQLAHGMAAAHAKGIIHRDLKPHNVLLALKSEMQNPKSEQESACGLTDSCTPKMTDFGLAKKVEGGSGLDADRRGHGHAQRTWLRSRPRAKKDVGPAADVYALGAILYECLTGRPPFRGPTPLDTIMQVVADEPAAVRQLQPSCPRGSGDDCHKCLHKEPGQTLWPSAAALAEDLRRFQAGEPITARPVGRLERGVKWVRRKPVVAGLTALVVLVLVAGSLVAWGLAVWALGEKGRADEPGVGRRPGKQRAATRPRLRSGKRRKPRKKNSAPMARPRKRGSQQAGRPAARHRRLRLYASKLAQAQQEWKDNNAARRRWSTWTTASGTCARGTSLSLDSFQQEPADPPWPHQPVTSVAISPDGKRIVTASDDSTVKLWDAGTGQQIFSLQGHTAAVTSVAFSPDGKRIVTGGNDNTVKVWDAARGRELFSLKHVVQPASVAFSPDGKRIVSGSRDGSSQGWDTDKSPEVFSVKGHTGVVTSVAFSPDGKRIVSGSYDAGDMKVWDADKDTRSSPSRGTQARSPAWRSAPTANASSAAARDNTVKVWDAGKGTELLSLKGHTGMVNSVAFSPDGKRIVSGSGDEHGEGVGRGQGPAAPLPQGAHPRGDQRGVQPRWQTHRQRQR